MDYFLTKKKLDELKEEVENLKTEGRKAIAEDLKTAKELGDLSENAEYIEARERQQRIERKISELEHTIRNAVIISTRKKRDVIDVGSTVTVDRAGEEAIYQIVGSNDADPFRGLISNESPLGQALLGHKEGDEVAFKSPGGNLKYKIKEIS